MKYHTSPREEEFFFDVDEIIVSKTDLKGIITYANDVFLNIAEYKEEDVIGQPHSLIRHPDMPRAVFKLLWDQLQAKNEVFAYVKNMTRTGAYYWVLAHVTPTFGKDDEIISYHSNRRVPERKALETINGLYTKLLAEENRHRNSKEGLASSYRLLFKVLDNAGISYDEFVLSL